MKTLKTLFVLLLASTLLWKGPSVLAAEAEQAKPATEAEKCNTADDTCSGKKKSGNKVTCTADSKKECAEKKNACKKTEGKCTASSESSCEKSAEGCHPKAKCCDADGKCAKGEQCTAVKTAGCGGAETKCASAVAGSEAKAYKAQQTCPVMGSKVSADSDYVDVDGRRFYVCCGSCKGKIKADPAKALEKLHERGETAALLAADGNVACKKSTACQPPESGKAKDEGEDSPTSSDKKGLAKDASADESEAEQDAA